MKQCFGYVRVSTVKQGDGVSLEAQKDAILEYADRKSLIISQWWEEKETAAKQGRPVFNHMVARLKRGDARGLIIHKIDRSARNYHDWAVISDLADSGIEFHIATESFDFNTYGGRMAADFMAVVAANYVRNLKTEIRKGQQGQLKIGLLPWAAPIGYRNNGAAQVKTPDPKTAPLVKRAYELYAGGTHSIRSLVTEMDRLGLRGDRGKALTKCGIEKMLSNPFYCGIIRVRRTGHTYQGAHEPIISPSLYQRVQDIKSGKNIKKVTRHNHLYRGLFRCKHCTRSLIGERQKRRIYYRCQTKGCPTMTIREDMVDCAMIRLLTGLQLSESDMRAAQAQLPELLAAEGSRPNVDAIMLQRQNADARLERLTDMLLDNLIDADAYQVRKRSLLVERQRLDEEIRNAEENTITLETIRKFLELVTSLAELYRHAAKAQKRRIVEWATSNRQAAGKSLCFEPSSRLQATQNMLNALCCAEQRDNSRIFDPLVLNSIQVLETLKPDKRTE